MPYLDKTKQKTAQHESYLRNKIKILERTRRRRFKIKKWFYEEFKSKLKCIKCDESDPVCLDFHHRNPKEKDKGIAVLLSNMKSKEEITTEVNKCDVLCANCHRKLHYSITYLQNKI